MVVTAVVRVAIMLVVGFVYLSVFLVGMVVVLVVVVLDSLCKGGSCRNCRNSLIKFMMCGKSGFECGGDGGGCGGSCVVIGGGGGGG